MEKEIGFFKKHERKEAHNRSRKAVLILSRHGQPEKYGLQDANLTETGIEDVLSGTDEILNLLVSDPSDKVVRAETSKRIRSIESSKIAASRISQEIDKGKLTKAELLVGNELDFITPDRTLDAVVEAFGIPMEEAYDTWLSLSHFQAKAIKAKSTIDVAGEIFERAAFWGDYVDENKTGPNLYHLLSTSETTLGAVLLHSNPAKKLKIGYGENLIIDCLPNGILDITFRGTKSSFEYNLPTPFWSPEVINPTESH